MNYVLVVLAVSATGLAYFTIVRSERLRCRCGRVVPPWILPRHERHVFLVASALMQSAGAIAGTVLRSPWLIVLNVVFAAVWWKMVQVHRSGRRRWPRRLAGTVRVDRHGRLRVVSGPA